MSNTDAGKPWPKVTWDQPTLEMTAEAVMLQNPYVTYLDLETCISSIRNLSETSLYRADPAHGWFFSTGGYQVTFIRSDDGSGWSAWPSISSYTARRYAREAA